MKNQTFYIYSKPDYFAKNYCFNYMIKRRQINAISKDDSEV